MVELTEAGRDVLQQATKTADQAEREFLGPLSAAQAAQLKSTLRALLS